MADPIMTLTTDFGDGSHYVAAMKGVILGINPAARLVDLSHRIPPQDVRQAAYVLAQAVPSFPPEVLHVVVVDPGVGTARAVLHVRVAGHRLLVPDNGCWTWLAGAADQPPVIHRLTESRYWRQPVSATFHGRDIFAPVAAHLSLGVPVSEIGAPATAWVALEREPLVLGRCRVVGVVVFVDDFGNLITNIPRGILARLAPHPATVSVAGRDIARWVRTYGEVEPGTVVALFSSSDHLEIAVNEGNAARLLGAGVGAGVTVSAPGRSPGLEDSAPATYRSP
jgi:S-adenosylmethionine hydrolase